MVKYDMYNNDLTNFIDAAMDTNIADIVGDIVGDILSVDIPVNIAHGNLTQDVMTFLGNMHISIERLNNKNKIVFTRKIGEVIYEEYTIDLNLINNFLVYGIIIEEREKGIILTNITRYYNNYQLLNTEKRLINSEETRKVFTYSDIEKIVPNNYFSNLSIEQKLGISQELMDSARFKGIDPSIAIILSLYRSDTDILRDTYSQFVSLTCNVKHTYDKKHGYDKTGKFKYITGNKSLERINELIHANITSESIKSLKQMFDCQKRDNDWESYIRIDGFNLLANHWIDRQRISELEEEYIGPSKLTLKKEYYQYLQALIMDAMGVSVTLPSPPNEIYRKLKNNYKEC